MKTNHLHYIVLLATIFLGCSCSEEIEKELTTGKTAVTIEVDGEEDADSRTVSFIGGTAYGEGLYDGKERPTVGAEASDGYEIDYFYGGPSDEPQKYNYTGSGSSVSYQVYLNGKDHKFKCKFKEKKRTLTLTANPTSGGTVTGGGTYKVKTNIPITAVAKSGYTFSGWTVTKGDAKIMNASSASTTVQLQSSNSTLQANFTAPKDYHYTIGVVNPPEDTSSALFISSSSNYDDIYEGYNNQTYKARYGETIELSIRYQSEKVDFAGWYENGTLLSTAEVYTFTPSDTPDRVRYITGKFVMKATAEPSLTFNISAESPAGFISSGSIEVNIDGNKTTLNTASGIRSFTITGRQKAVLTVKDLPDYINGEGRWLGWYVFYNGSEKQVSTSYTYEITTQGDATVYTARFQK